MTLNNFSEFWIEIRRPFLVATFKALIYFVITLPLTVIFLRWVQCNGWWGYTDPVKTGACVDMAYPFLYWTRILSDFPKVFLPGFMVVLLAILYLEWDKYKKDKPSAFTHEKGCEGPPGYTRRLKWVQACAWEIAGQTIAAIQIDERRKRYEGAFSQEELLRALRRKFARSENKPVEETESRIQWRIVQNNGREVHIDLQRQQTPYPAWIMQTQFFEWAGRKQPPSLVETHITEFVPLSKERVQS